jgi:toxin ParE1/3/4
LKAFVDEQVSQRGFGSSSEFVHEHLPGFRSWPLARYPYLVFYVEHPDHVEV